MDVISRKECKRKFTLVELLTVVGVMAVLVGISIGIVPLINKKSADAKTQGILKTLELALENYKEKYGYYLMSEDGKASVFILDKVDPSKNGPNDKDNIKNNFCQFIEYEKLIGDCYEVSDGRYMVLDAYGAPLIYRSPGFFNRGKYDLGSMGANLKLGADEKVNEITTAKTSISEGEYKSYFGLGDDITNFKR